MAFCLHTAIIHKRIWNFLAEVLKITYFELYRIGKILLDSVEVLLIFEKVFGVSRERLFFCKEKSLKICETNIFLNLLFERKNGRPLAYVLQETQFMGMTLRVREGVLIPRDDTEVLVRGSLEILKDAELENQKILDLCSGSGAVALAVEKNLSQMKSMNSLRITAVEISDAATEILRENILINNSFVRVLQGDVFKIHDIFEKNSIHAILSNPPYIESDAIKTLDDDVQKEPRLALDGGKTGLDFYHLFASKWFEKLKFGGFIAMEVGYQQSQKVAEIFYNHSDKISFKRDINGINRVVIVYKR